jgi:hypothetical protein
MNRDPDMSKRGSVVSPAAPVLPSDLRQEFDKEDKILGAVWEFNRKPSRGIPLLCRAFKVDESPRSVAHLLHSVPGLLSEVIGEFLSNKSSEEILKCYFFETDLRQPFLRALREALNSSLHLPREGEQIDWIVQNWAHCWAFANRETCRFDGEQAYILAFASVLLNSDLHNPNVPHKMSVPQFIENIRGAISPECLSDFALNNLYNEIRAEEFQYRRTDGNEVFALAAPKLRGTLQRKRRGVFGSWMAYYFVLTDGCLYFFRDQHEEAPLGLIQLIAVSVQAVGRARLTIETVQGDLQFVKFEKPKPKLVKGVKQVLLKADSEATRDRWLYRIRTSCVYAGFMSDAPQQPSDTTSGSDDVSQPVAGVPWRVPPHATSPVGYREGD